VVYFLDHGTPWRREKMSKTLIQWTDHSWGYQQGCSPKSPGCSRCYAEKIARRLAKNPKVAQYNEAIAQWDGTLNFHLQGLIEPLIRQESAIWFPSMTDPFHESAPDEWIAAAMLVAALCPQHRFLLLTKRLSEFSSGLPQSRGKMFGCQHRIDLPPPF
jgi:protein gp37